MAHRMANARTGARVAMLLIAFGVLAAGIVFSRMLPGLPAVTEHIPGIEAPDHTAEDPGDDFTAATPGEPGIPSGEAVTLLPDLHGDALRDGLQDFAKAGHQPLSYRRAREVMYWIADNQDGVVLTIYAHEPIALEPDVWPDPGSINCEHLWPQSKGAKQGPMKSDLFHLRPAVPGVNSTRGNHPFGETVNGASNDRPWQAGPDEHGSRVFEPPADVRGDISRSMFYFSVRYDMPIDSRQEQVLRRWHDGDPVDDRERRRALVVTEYQGNSNPFIEDPRTVERIDDF